MAPRYSIIRGDFPSDQRADVGHFRVYTLIGRHTDEQGWCRLKQITIGDAVGLSRKTVNLKITDLVEWGYVEKNATDATGRAIWYRTILDAPFAPPQTGDEDDDGDCETSEGPVTGALHVGCNSAPTCNPIEVTPGVTHRVTPGVTTGSNTERPLFNDLPPLPPSGGNSAHPGDEQWKTAALAGLRAGGRHPLAVEHLIAPLLSSDKRLSLGKGAERNAVLAEIAEAAGGLSLSALQAAVKRIIEQPKKVTPSILRAEVDQARNHGAMFVIKPGMPQWTRWLEHLDVVEPRKAKVIRKAGVWQVPSEWPPAAGKRTEAA